MKPRGSSLQRRKIIQSFRILSRLFLVLLSVGLCRTAPGATKKLIEFGWDEPDSAFMREHAVEMEKMPFDGCVFHIDFKDAKGGKGSFTWQAWGDRKFLEEDLKDAVADLKTANLKKLTNNFLRFNTTPAKLDWFDDYSAVTNNARLAVTIAYETKCPGLLFDIEQYDGNLFDYSKQRDRASKSWETYAAQARQRGREVMQAFQGAYPQITLFLTFGYSLPWAESNNGKKPLAECHYGLLAPFLDGMLDVANEGVRFVDGCELAYGYKDISRFEKEYRAVSRDLLSIVANPEKYQKHFSFGFGLWMDNQWRKVGWNADDFSKNFYSPEAFETSLRKAIETADEYVWIYTESPKWWTKEGGPEKLPAAYIEATRRARNAIK